MSKIASKIVKEVLTRSTKNKDNKNKGVGFLAGLVFGGLAGATVALVMAPHSGPETRTMLMDKGVEIKGQLQNKSTEIKEQVAETVLHAKSQAEGAVADVQGKVRQIEQSTHAATRAAQAAWRDENNKALAN